MSGFNAPDLRLLLEQDGHTLKKAGNEFVTFCPFHEEGSTPNLHVNLRKQVFVCRSCGAGGGIVDYLVKRRGMTLAEAGKVYHGEDDAGPGVAPRERRQREPEPEPPPKYIARPPTRHNGEWQYRDAAGVLKYIVQRYDLGAHPKKPGKQRKNYGQYTPVVLKKDGKDERCWLVGLTMHRDRPLYRLPEILDQMEADPTRGVNVVEGEKCADLFRAAMPKAIVTTSSGGGQAYHLADWTPLMGRKVVIFADADQGGHRAARWLADHLGPHCPAVTLILPPVGSTDYPDVGDVLEKKDGAKFLPTWMKRWMERWEPPAPPEEPPPIEEEDGPPTDDEPPPHEEAPDGPGEGKKKKSPPPPPPDDDTLGENRWFIILGNVADRVLIKLRTNIITAITRSSLTAPQSLIALAPDLNWWRAIMQVENLSRATAMIAGAGIIRIADDIGQIDMNTMKDRGVCRNERGDVVWNLGNRLLVNGHETDMAFKDGNVYQAAPAISLGDARREVMSLDERAEIAKVLLRYRWATPEDGKRLLGWIATSVIGGMLDWRPHIWMLGPKDIGKSWIVKTVMMRIHASMAVRTSDATPAAVARRMGGASMPLYVDEAEPGRWWVPDVITLCRIASGADGERLRADAGAGINSQEPQFSACMSSTKMPSMEDADNSRFTLVRFDPKGVDDWPKLKGEIVRLFDPPSTTPRDLRHALVMDAEEIVENAKGLTAQLEGSGRAARDAMITGALSAGYAWWTGSDEIVDNRTPLLAQPQADARNVLMEILGHRIRTKQGEDRALLDFLTVDENAKEVLGSYGLKVLTGGLAILPRHPAILRILSRGTARGADLRSLLMQMDGVMKAPDPMRIGGLRARPLIVKQATLEEMGVDWSSTLPV